MLPRGSDPSVVTRTVSGPISACTSFSSARITVRQTPFTARLSPGESSGAIFVPMRNELKAVLAVSGLLNVLFGVYPGPLVDAAAAAAKSLF